MVIIILCSYNGEKHIAAQIDSILCQDYAGFRLHVFDDASTDKTPEILEDYKIRYPQVFSYTRRTNSTGSACMNFLKAINEIEESDYYMLSDQDDVWHIDKISKMLATMQSHEAVDGKSTPLIIHSDAAVKDEHLNTIHDSFMIYEKISPERVSFNQLLLQNCVTGGAMIFNKSLKDKLDMVDIPTDAAIHDHWMAIVASAFGKIYYLDEALYDYRQHSDNQIGAYKAGFLSETLRRLGLGEESKEEIDAITKKEFSRIFAQAECFLDTYGDYLSKKQTETLKSFIRIPEVNRAHKIAIITKYGFFFNNYYRAIGELFFIP